MHRSKHLLETKNGLVLTGPFFIATSTR